MLAHHTALLQQLQDLASEALATDADGNCLIEIDDVMVTLKSREDVLVVHVELGSFIADHSAAFWRQLMEFNAPLIEADRGAIAVADDETTIVLVNSINTLRLPDAVVSDALSNVIAQARRLIDLLHEEMPDPLREQASLDSISQPESGTENAKANKAGSEIGPGFEPAAESFVEAPSPPFTSLA